LNLGHQHGSHLGLAFAKYHGGSVNKAVTFGHRGPGPTIKRPALTDKMFAHAGLIDAIPS
jgi:hypothetical protein